MNKITPSFLSLIKIFSSIFLIFYYSNAFCLTILHWHTTNGTPVYFIATHQLPIIDIGIAYNAGSSRDGNAWGKAALTCNLLSQGAKGISADEIANRFEETGTFFNSSIDKDKAVFTLRSLSSPNFLMPALRTFTEVLNSPDFPTLGFSRVKQQLKIAVQEETQTPRTRILTEFYRTLYGSLPYGSPIEGTEQSLDRLSLEEIKQFYAQYYVAKNRVITLVGDLTLKKAHKVAEQLSVGIKIGKKSLSLNKFSTLPVTAFTKKIFFPSSQSSILLGQQGISMHDPDYYALFVGNHILGGGILTSRLFTEVRNKRGLCYGINSIFKRWQMPGPFYILLQTRKTEVTSALKITRDIFSSFVELGPTEEEVISAKKSIIQSFPLNIANNSSLLEELIIIGFYHLPLDFLETYTQKINSVELKDIKRALKKHLEPQNRVTIILGESGA